MINVAMRHLDDHSIFRKKRSQTGKVFFWEEKTSTPRGESYYCKPSPRLPVT
jgi:hypothetical protein